MMEYLEKIADWLDNILMKHRAINRCPECGEWTDRKIKGVGRSRAEYSCSSCGWNQS